MKKIMILLVISVMLFSTVTSVAAEEYVVQEGDVLWKIAKEHKTTVQKIIDLNDIKNGNLIFVDQKIQLPESEAIVMTNSEKAVALIESIGTNNLEPIGYVNPTKYIQHNLGVADGLAGFGAVVALS